MLNQNEIECLNACNDCTIACLQCSTACLEEVDIKFLAKCITLNLECANICHMTAYSIARDGNKNKASTLCAEACQNCAAECEKHAMEHCKICADVCNRCAELCRMLVH